MKHFDLFSGYGGFTMACEKHGIETIGFSEIDKYAIQVLSNHYPNIKNYGDISKINTEELPEFDLLTGGSPCQDLSVAGKQKGLAGERSGLFFHFIRILKEKQPTYFIWENVKGALSSNAGWDFARVEIEMVEAGYSIQWQILNAKHFGVAQSRDRVFVIGTRRKRGREIFFEQEGNSKAINQLIGGSQGNRVYGIDGISCTQASQAGGQGAKTGLYAIPEATKKGYAIAEEGDSINLSVPNSKTRRGRVGKGIAQTIDTGMQQHTIKNSRIRRLTPLECERLMGLPDNWTAEGTEGKISDTQRYKLCGNGVVVNVVEEIIKKLIC